MDTSNKQEYGQSKQGYGQRPVCPHDESCGGCIYQGVPYEQQLAEKEKLVRDLIVKNGIKTERTDPIEPAPRLYGYRNKMEFTFGDLVKGGEMTLGMHMKKRFMSVVTVDHCQLVHRDMTEILSAVLGFCAERGYTKYNKKTHEGMMRNLVIRTGERTGQILVNIVTTGAHDAGGRGFDGAAFRDLILGLGLEHSVAGILHTTNDDPSDAIKCGGLDVLYGEDFYTERIMGLDFKVGAFSFFQTNISAVERLYEEATGMIEDVSGKLVYDLFCGTGTITQTVAGKAREVTGVEIVEDSVRAARENAAANGIENCGFICGDVLKVLPSLTERPDVIIMDPPRAGIHPKVLPMIASYGAPEILYISCNPKTMMPDIAVLQDHGYAVKRLKPYDNFPMTKHVECAALMTLQKPSPALPGRPGDLSVDVPR